MNEEEDIIDRHGDAPTFRTKRQRKTARNTGPMLAGGAIAVVLLAVGVVPRLQRNRTLDADAKKARTSAPLVDVIHPAQAKSVTSLVLPGNVQADDTTTINAQSTGYVRKYLVDIGYHVRRGQVLAIIESPEVDQQLIAAQANTAKSAATVGQSEAEVDRMRAQVAQATAQTSASRAATAQAKADLIRYQAKAQQAKSAIGTARANLAETKKLLDARQADVVRARATVDIATKTLKRWQELGKVNAVALQEVDEKQADYDTADASLAAAQAAVEEADANIQGSTTQVQSSIADAQAAAADVDAAQQRLSAAKANVTSSLAGIQAARADVSADQESVVAARSALESSQATAGEYTALKNFQQVVAPFDGVITARNIDVGSLVGPGIGGSSAPDPTRAVTHTGLFGIARTDSLRIQANVPQSFVPYLHIGQEAQVTVEQTPGRVFTGKVFTMSGALDTGSRTLLVEILVPNPSGALIPGMYADIKLVGTRQHPPMVVPANVLMFNAQGERVATVTADHKVHFQSVQIARDLGNSAEVASGLTPTDTLISDPSDDLTEGETVHPVAANQEKGE